ncbi:MAG: branched-chain amino acid ABC transporter permease [Acidimicrobiales bacterium]
MTTELTSSEHTDRTLRLAFPWGIWIRRVILAALVVLVVVAAIKTFTLPADAGPGQLSRYTAATWRAFIIGGLSEGAVLALIALGYSLVYGILRMINFAHGEVFMMGGFASYFVADRFSDNDLLATNPVVAMIVILAVAIGVSVLVAILLERVCYRPLRNAPRLVPLITAIGASLFLQNTARGFFGPQARGYPRPDFLVGSWNILGFKIDRIDLVMILVSIVLVAILDYFVSSTRTGRSMRAVALDADIAKLMGIDVDRVIVTTFAIGGVLAGVAGVMFAMRFQQISFTTGFRPGIAAFTAAVLGGIGSIRGAALGALLVGLLRSLGPALLVGFEIPSVFQLEDAVTFLVLVFVLLYRPGGLLGSAAAEKL